MPFKFSFCGKAEKEFFHVLDYSHKNLLNVPTEIYEHAQTLEDLYLDANQLKDLPKALFTLQHLRTLNICDNEIISLPSNVSNLVHLIEFDISKNGFLELPDNIKGMKSLEHFDLSVNPLGRLPDGFTMLLNLTNVYLNDTFLDFLPANIGRMAKLEVLEVRDNHLSMIPKSMSRLQSLRRLDLGNNEFSDVPEVIGTFANLEELWLDGNKIKLVPPEIGNLKKLRYFDISENTVDWIADEIGECCSMTDLHFSTNNIESLPENLCKLKFLETLKVDDNGLRALPTSIGGLSSLVELICSSNELVNIPPGIGLLRQLKTFNADENYIEELPEEIGSCVSLTVVSIRQNRLLHLPDEIGRLANLAVFNVSSNMLENLPYSLMKLKKLKALWLSENQAKPLIPLQTDWDEESEKRFLTCYMFPQRPIEIYEEEHPEDNQESVNQSLLEEEWKKRTSVVFDLEDDDPQVVRLTRQPTPFPKDIRDKINQFRNQSIAKGHVSNHHPVGEYVIPQHPYRPADEVETRLHGHHGSVPPNGHHEPYTGHQNMHAQPHVTEEEKMLLEQLKNTSLGSDVPHMNDPPPGVPQRTNHVNFTVPVIPSPITGRRYQHDDDREKNAASMENIHLSVSGENGAKRNIKLSSDSGLGSSELVDERQQFQNDYPTIHEEGEIFRITIKKTPNLGFSVSGGKDAPGNPFRPGDTGIFITRVIPDGPAAHILQPGDKLLEVNGRDFRCVQHEIAVGVLKASQEVNLLVARRNTTPTNTAPDINQT